MVNDKSDVNYDASTQEEMNERSVGEEVKNEEGKIIKYRFNVFIKDKDALSGELSREEMQFIHNAYSNDGASLTRREVCREFSTRFSNKYTFEDFKRILSAFKITKAVPPLAPHIILERSHEDLVKLTYDQKENNYLLKLEQERAKEVEKRYKLLVKENLDLKENISNLDSILNRDKIYTVYEKKTPIVSGSDDLILHLSDFHIGAKVRKTSLFKNEYNYNVVKERLENLLERIGEKTYDTIIVNILGDMIDGIDMKTSRRDHLLPQNMDNFEQVHAYLELMEWFFVSLNNLGVCNNIKIYSVKNGNHDGITGYVSTIALLNKINIILPHIETKLFEDFFGFYEFKGHKFIITHGKDDEFMKRGLPLNITDKDKIMIYNWLEDQKIYGNNIHIIKGDLHSDNLNSSYKLDYRNVLSLFGSSDYSSFNFERNNYGVSFEVLNNMGLLRGAFVNL